MKPARVWAVFGSSGTGKTAWVRQQLARLKPTRLMLWDPLGDYVQFGQAVDALPQLVQQVSAPSFAVRFVPAFGDSKRLAAEFAGFCRIAWAAERCTVVVEELSRVTTPSQAPPAWSQITTAGRHRGLHVIGVSQFPAQVDKAFVGNATLIHSGHLANVRHRQAVAVEIDASPDELRTLADLEWLEWTRGTRGLKRGRLSFKG